MSEILKEQFRQTSYVDFDIQLKVRQALHDKFSLFHTTDKKKQDKF